MASLRIFLTICMMMLVLSPSGILPANIDIGVCYGMLGNNLPTAADVVELFKDNGISKVRLFDPNPDALKALQGSGIRISLGVRNEDLPSIASTIDAATSWFKANVQPYLDGNDFSYISVGNEVIPGPFASNVAPAMHNLQTVLQNHNLGGIKVTTSVAEGVLGASYPPSAGVFSQNVLHDMVDVLRVLSMTGSPLMVNTYPYFAYATTPDLIRLDYALFTASKPVVIDGNMNYLNLFDAMVDALYWAMEKQGFGNVRVVVSESGWPSAGNGNITTPELASTYNKNFLNHIVSGVGTPKRPGAMEGFIFAMFNENQKPSGVEQNWGLFYPNKQPVYPIFG